MDLLNKLFNIRRIEWPRVLLLFSMFAIANAGAIWGTTIAYAAFLQQVGLWALPWVLVVSSLLSILVIAIYTAFVDRVPDGKLLIAIFALSAAGIALGLALLWLNLPRIAYPVLYLLFLALLAVFNPHFTTYVNSFYDIQSAKRILPVVSAGARVGAIGAGLTMSLLTASLAPEVIIVIWLVTYLIAMGLVWLMPYLLHEVRTGSDHVGYAEPSAGASLEKSRPSYMDNLREGFRYIVQSAYLRWMALATLLLTVLMALVEYRSSGLLLDVYGTQRELASFLALLVSGGNIVALPVLLFGLSRLVTRLGLGNASLLFPVGNLAICGGLVLVPGHASAAAAYLDRTAFRIAFQYPIDGLFYNAVPLRVKGRARACVNGLIVPLGSLIGGLVLLVPMISTFWWLVPTLIGVLAVAYMFSSLVVRQQYSQALVELLGQEDYSFLLSREASELTVADPATLAQLQQKLTGSTSPEFTLFMAQLISQIGGGQVVPVLEQVARTAADSCTRAAMLEVLAASGLGGDAVRQLYIDFLDDPDPRVRYSAVAGLEGLAGPKDGQFQAHMLDILSDQDVNVRVQGLVALVHTVNFYELPLAVQALDQLLFDPDPHCRAQGVRILGEIGNDRAICALAEYLIDPADEVRLEAALAVEALSHRALPNLKASDNQVVALVVQRMSRLLCDSVERVRQAALITLGHIGTRESYQAMAEALADASPQVRTSAVDALVQVGKSIIPIVHPRLNAPNPQLHKMAVVVLSRINPREFGALVLGSPITGNLLAIYRNVGFVEALTPYLGYSGVALLCSALREQNQQLLDEIFYLLSAIHDPGTVKVIGESLHSQVARTRANAREALEALTTPQIASLISPLFEPELSTAQLFSCSQDTWDMQPPSVGGAIQQLMTHPGAPWLCAITAFALGQVGAALRKYPPASSELFPEVPRIVHQGEVDSRSSIARSTAKTRRIPPPGPLDLFIEDSGGSKSSEALTHEAEEAHQPPLPALLPVDFTLSEIETLLEAALADPADEVRRAARAAQRIMAAGGFPLTATEEEGTLLSTIEKIIFLKEVPFFERMTIDQLRALASVCEEEFFEENACIFKEGDPGGVLYVIVNGRVGIEQERRKGSVVRLATIAAHSYFGEVALFDNSPRTASAVAIQDTLTLRLRHEPLIALARQYPEVSLELIHALSTRLREANDRISELTRSRPRQLQKLFDELD
jgi:CRP/FNR family cyclic AMP-dependent transcriptional regulator